MTTMKKLEQEIAALKKVVEQQRDDRREILLLISKSYILKREAERIPVRPWWAFWRPDPSGDAWAKYSAAYTRVEDVTLRQMGYPTVTKVSTEWVGLVGDPWSSVTYKWQGPADMRPPEKP